MVKHFRVWPGSPYPLGSTFDGAGVNFAIFSENATGMKLCLFESEDSKAPVREIQMPEYTENVFHCYLPDARPGLLYGYRVEGPFDPSSGHRFNPNKILLDPYAKAVFRVNKWDSSLFGYKWLDPEEDLSFNDQDNAEFCPLAAVVDTSFSWGCDKPPSTPWYKTIIYEAHLKGLTMTHPDVPEHLRGTYEAVCSEPILKHLKDLKVTAIEFMPVHQHIDEQHLLERGLANYWGYNTLSFFAPDTRYARNKKDPLAALHEFKTMVCTLHRNGIEVILDVVYNHTAEGNHMGPTLSFRGIDNASYYRLDSNPRYYYDFTGCGNTLNVRHPRVLQLIMDSLRYWVQEMHVDGFRFDLASALARTFYEVDKLGAFFDIIQQDPIVSQVKLIAEPWDLGEGGYQVGNFPVLWTEWNGKYRDCIRSFWNGQGATLAELASRISGSADLYCNSGRKPHASINFVTCHDGFTLHDLESYNGKHNDANQENNQDGCDNNNSWNCGFEGPCEDPNIIDLRYRQKCNMIATMFLSLGVPMLSGGDELSQTQGGNNNAYCQDNEITWYNWNFEGKEKDEKEGFLMFVKRLCYIRRKTAVLLRRTFFTGQPSKVSGIHDITWHHPEGRALHDHEWNNPDFRAMAYIMEGDSIDEVRIDGTRVVGDTLLVLINAMFTDVKFVLPVHLSKRPWNLLLTTSQAFYMQTGRVRQGGEQLVVPDHTIVLFRLQREKKHGGRKKLWNSFKN